MSNEIKQIEQQIYALNEKLTTLRKASPREKVPNYTFDTLEGETSLLDLFGENDKLLMIHNMGQGCRYCMLWADGFNGFLPHLELYEDGEVADDVPDMVPVFQNPPGDLPGNSIITLGRDLDAGVPGLSNGAEGVILYLWNGDTNLVTDIDVFVWRNTGTSTSFMFSKTGVEVGGDTYQPETAIDDQDVFPTAHAFEPERISWFDVADRLPRYEGFVDDNPPLRHGPEPGLE